ncbi:lycopene cyclase family protein [Deinococcus multiflagellatus]|uniref:lycopene cyclase family protein n=1 Tax=Deinococcus multiflagellatus TaxID=1656887 RepID=UPI001CCD76A6|nr:lycopene cyclase family protein [Deinococcus multiflagellatus]MBZ9711688.1 lycopene cyclase family protein [Deinococcus multiflagellatus]
MFRAPPFQTDVLLIGGGPAALALAAALAPHRVQVRVVAPHPPRPPAPTYGAWLDDLPPWAQACAAQVWSDVRVYTGPQPTPLLRPYALLDNARLLQALLARAQGALTWTVGEVQGARPDGHGWTVQGRGGEHWHARVVVDASGHAPALRRAQHPGGAALQTAFGVVGRFARPPCAPGSMVWMDYRAPHGPAPEATFLYAMHLGGDRYFVEETSLIARPAPSRAWLRARLHARLHAQGTPLTHTESEEWVAFPMNAAAPPATGALAYGAAGGLVHPISGFQVAGALHMAPAVAQALAGALQAGTDPHAAGWAALWSPERRAARAVHLLGVQALLNLPPTTLPAFFEAFFALPPAQWRAFLDPATPAGPLARTMLLLFAALPAPVRLPLARAALAQPGTSVQALAASLKRSSGPSHPQAGWRRDPGPMTNPDHAENAVRRHEDTDQHEVIEDGMQGTTGSTDANGLDQSADLGQKLEELRENLGGTAE